MVDETNIQNNTVDYVMQNNVVLRIAKRIVFQRYIAEINNMYGNVSTGHARKITDFDKSHYHVLGMERIDKDIKGDININWDDISEYFIQDFGSLNDISYLSYNKDSLLEPVYSKEQIFDIPASGYVFTSGFNKTGNFLLSDWSYKPEFYKDNDVKYYIFESTEPYKVNDTEYWHANYNFQSGYKPEEYMVYDLKEEYFDESRIQLNAESKKYNVEKSYKKMAAIAIVYLYDLNKTENKYKYDSNCVPVIYCELHKPISTAANNIIIEWSDRGIISVE